MRTVGKSHREYTGRGSNLLFDAAAGANGARLTRINGSKKEGMAIIPQVPKAMMLQSLPE